MYRIEYNKGNDVYTVHSSFDSTYTVVSGNYHRETNTIGTLTFTVMNSHPVCSLFEEYAGVVSLYWNTRLLYKFRIFKIKRDLYNRRTLQCEGLLSYLNDSVIEPYTFNETSWLYPTATGNHSCTIIEYLRELVARHNVFVTPGQRFTFVDETNGAFNDIKFTVKQDSYVSAWSELESKVIRNVGGYVQIRHNATENQLVYKAELTEQNSQQIEYSVNLKSLELETGTGTVISSIYPLSRYTDADGKERICILPYYYIDDTDAVRRYGRIIKYVEYKGLSTTNSLEAFARYDLRKYLNRTKTLTISATDPAVSDPSLLPLEVDKLTTIHSPVNGVNVTLPLNSFDVDIVNPLQSQYRFNSEFSLPFRMR